MNLKGLSLAELRNFVESLGEKKYRAGQLFSWLYAKGVQSFDEMSDISKEFRDTLKRSASISNLQTAAKNISSDGTIKFLFRLEDGVDVESVLIPPDQQSPGFEKRLTLCVSTQVGCPLGCKFCATGFMGFTRNLTAGEIVDQVIQAQRQSERRISNVVFMGMGEPMLNYENVFKSIALLNDDHGLNIGARHITISTAGYADKIRQLANEKIPVKLALSLHSLDSAKRASIMPITKKYSVEELIESLIFYYRKTKHRPTFEYIVFEGFNDAPGDAKALIALSKRIPCKVNLIPFHSIEFMHTAGNAANLHAALPQKIEAFAQTLRNSDMTVSVRNSSGIDIQAACGQLAISHGGKVS
ncbi:MAG: 23S rRNA (adenine(2503)-C(2))-methyltransferase RlmN [Bacteroidota bacterium]